MSGGPFGGPGGTNPDYEFRFDRDPEDFLDGNIEQYLSDMVDKYYGNRDKESEYNEAIARIESHKRIDPTTNAEYIEFYPGKDSDLKLTQLELFDEKASKIARYNNGDTSVYATEDERIADQEYISTNNHAYNHKQATQNNLMTLGKYGERMPYLPVRGTGNGIRSALNVALNGALVVRNAVSSVYRFVGRPVAAIYGRVARQRSGIYSNKPTHRLEARKDYFIRAENERLAAAGRAPRPFRTLMKARFNAIFRYKQGNAAVLEAGYQDLRSSYIEKAKVDYYASKYEALNNHLTWLNDEKVRLFADTSDPDRFEKINRIEQAEISAREQLDRILNNPEISSKVVNGEKVAVVQTDAVSLNQHDRANKANVTRVVTGVKMLAVAGARYLGPKLQDWMIEHSKIQTTETIPVTTTRVTPDKVQRTWVDEVTRTQEVPDYTTVTKISSEQDLLDQFSIKKLMESEPDTVSYAYDKFGRVVPGTNTTFFRGAAQRINGRVVSLSDGNGFDATGITSGVFSPDMLTDGHISSDVTIFDIVAALQRKAGNDVTSQDLINQVLSCGSKEEQDAMIMKLAEGLDIWRSKSGTGIATGWTSPRSALAELTKGAKTTAEQVVTGSHLEEVVVTPGHFEETIIKGATETVTENVTRTVLVNNPRVVDALGLAERIGNGMTIMDAIHQFFENVRDTRSRARSNKKEPREYNPTNKAGFTGNNKNQDRQINTTVLNDDIRNEINGIDR